MPIINGVDAGLQIIARFGVKRSGESAAHLCGALCARGKPFTERGNVLQLRCGKLQIKSWCERLGLLVPATLLTRNSAVGTDCLASPATIAGCVANVSSGESRRSVSSFIFYSLRGRRQKIRVRKNWQAACRYIGVRIAAKPVNTNSAPATSQSSGKASGQSFLEILMSGAGVGVQGTAMPNGQAQGQSDGESSGSDTAGNEQTETNLSQAQAGELAKAEATTASQSKEVQIKDAGVAATPASVPPVPNPVVLMKLDPTLLVAANSNSAQAATTLETTVKAAEGKQTGVAQNSRGKSSATTQGAATQGATNDEVQAQAAAMLVVPAPAQQNLPVLQALALRGSAVAATKNVDGTDESKVKQSADQPALLSKPQLVENTQKAIEAALPSASDVGTSAATLPKASDGKDSGSESILNPQNNAHADALQAAQKSTYLTALLAQKTESASSAAQPVQPVQAAQPVQGVQAVQANQVVETSPAVQTSQAANAIQTGQTVQNQAASGADHTHANASHAASALSNSLNANSSIHGVSTLSPSSNTKGDTQNSDDSSRAGQGGIGSTQHLQAVASQAVPASASSTDSTAGQMLTAAAPAGSAHIASLSAATGVPSEAAPRHAADTAAMGSDGGSTVSSGTINTARLIQNMNDTEMRVGMRSAEFGDISIRTMVSQQQVQAQISVNHSELVNALSAHIPSVQAKIGNEYGLHASIEVSQNSASFTNENGQSSQRDQKPFVPSTLLNNLAAPVEIDRLPMRAIAPALLDTTRLDIRA